MSIPKAIADELERLDKMRKEAEELSGVARLAHAVADVFKDRFGGDSYCSVSITRWALTKPFVNLRICVNSFRDVIPVLTDLASRGWHTDKDCPYSDYPELERRTFNMIHGKPTPVIDPATSKVCEKSCKEDCKLRVMCFIRSDSKACCKVQIGTKQKPVYKFVCD